VLNSRYWEWIRKKMTLRSLENRPDWGKINNWWFQARCCYYLWWPAFNIYLCPTTRMQPCHLFFAALTGMFRYTVRLIKHCRYDRSKPDPEAYHIPGGIFERWEAWIYCGKYKHYKKNAQYYNKLYNITFTKTYHVNTFENGRSLFKVFRKKLTCLYLKITPA